MPRILVVECMQEISSFNPVESAYEQFVIQRGQEVFDLQRGMNTSIGGALAVLEAAPGIELVPAYSAFFITSGGTDFGQISAAPRTAELIDPLRNSSIVRVLPGTCWI